MTYKSDEKSFFENVVEDKKEDLEKIEKKGSRKFLKLYDFGASKLRDEIKRKPAQYFFLFITSFLGSVITSAVALIIFSGNMIALFAVPKALPESVQAIKVTNATVESQKYDPLLLASKLKKKEEDLVIIDIRPLNEYVAGHIITAINIPVYGTGLVVKNGDVDRNGIVETFKTQLIEGKLIIIYAQNSYSTIPTQVASILNTDKIPVKSLAVGWEEWKHLNK